MTLPVVQPVVREVQVDPAVLDRVADDVDQLRRDADRAAADVESAAEELGRRLAGWRLARATHEAAFAWRDDATLVAGWLDDYASALRRCAQDYRHQDLASAAALQLFPQVDPW